LFERTEGALTATPGVSFAAASTVPLIADDTWATNVGVEGSAGAASAPTSADYANVGAGFFQTVGIPILAGREFTTADAAGAPKVAIVNETFANAFAHGLNVVGRRMRIDSDHGPFDTEIVGLARDAKYSDVKADTPAVFYTPYRQDDHLGEATFYVRTPLAPEALLKTIPTVMAGLDPNLPVQSLRTMADQVRESETADRAMTALATSFALLATLLAAIGLYGVLAYTVSQRTREFGVRIALGAAPGRVRALVLRSILAMTIAGGLVGAGIALIVGHYLQSLLYQMKGDDPWVVAAAVATLTTVALAAAFMPAWRASRIDPMRALRSE
jgi:predicted permease